MHDLFEEVKGESLTAYHGAFYHGTNPVAAAAILKNGYIEATHAVDSDSPVVCVTSCPDIGSCFATEFIRMSSECEVGFVFEIDGSIVEHEDTYPFEADTASFDEKEFRIEGDVPSRFIKSVKMVGDPQRLHDLMAGDDDLFLDELWEYAIELRVASTFGSSEGLYNALAEICQRAS